MLKEFVSPEQFLRHSFALAARVYDSGYRPDVLLAVWRGGAPVGIAVHEFFVFKGLELDHAPVHASSYTGVGQQAEVTLSQPDVELARSLVAGRSVLLVDDIFDSGATLRALKDALRDRAGEIKTATIYYKPEAGPLGDGPDFYVEQTSAWVVFPHELDGLSDADIRSKGEAFNDLLGNGLLSAGQGTPNSL